MSITDLFPNKFLGHFKGQLISKANCQAMNSSKKRTNEFVFTSMRHVFVRFLGESSARKKRFEIYWPLADNFKSGSTVVASLICPPLVYSMTDSCDAKFGHSPMNIKSWGDDDWIFHMWDSQPDNILFWVCSQIVMKINESCILYRSEVQSV